MFFVLCFSYCIMLWCIVLCFVVWCVALFCHFMPIATTLLCLRGLSNLNIMINWNDQWLYEFLYLILWYIILNLKYWLYTEREKVLYSAFLSVTYCLNHKILLVNILFSFIEAEIYRAGQKRSSWKQCLRFCARWIFLRQIIRWVCGCAIPC